MDFTWKPEYSVNIEEIDKQHQEFIVIIKEVSEAKAMEKGRNKILNSILMRLLSYAEYHFATEEKYFAMFDYPDATKHIAEHSGIIEKIIDIKAKHFSGSEDIVEELSSFLMTWLVDHIHASDMRYVETFKSHGLK